MNRTVTVLILFAILAAITAPVSYYLRQEAKMAAALHSDLADLEARGY